MNIDETTRVELLKIALDLTKISWQQKTPTDLHVRDSFKELFAMVVSEFAASQRKG